MTTAASKGKPIRQMYTWWNKQTGPCFTMYNIFGGPGAGKPCSHQYILAAQFVIMLISLSRFLAASLNELCLSYAGKDIEKQCSGIYPLQSVYVRKVKILRAPRFDVSKLMEVHGDYTEEVCSACRIVLIIGMQDVSVGMLLHIVTCNCCVSLGTNFHLPSVTRHL